MSKYTLIFLLGFLVAPMAFGQKGMINTPRNFSSFSETQFADKGELQNFTFDENHPEFGQLPYNAPCEDCFEVVEERTQYSRKFLRNGKNGKEFLIQKGYSPLHYKNNSGQWVTHNPKLQKISQTEFGVNNDFYTISINTQLGYVSLENKRKSYKSLTFHQNLQIEYLDHANDVTSIQNADWSNYQAGNDGVRVSNIFPNIDLEINIYGSTIKSNFIVKSNPGSAFRLKEKVDPSFLNRVANNEEQLSVLNFFENGENSYHIDKILISDKTKKRDAFEGFYRIDGDHLYYQWDQNDISALSYPYIIDPTVTSNNVLPQASILGSGLNNAGGFTNGCLYNLSVPTPPDCEITDIDWTFTYRAQNFAVLAEGACKFYYGGCVSPAVAGFFWFCNDPFAGGTCAGTNVSIFGDFQACVPPPQCASYNMDFTMEFYDAWGGAACSSTFILAETDWTMTITGEEVDEPAPPTSSAGTSICPGTTTTLNATGVYGVPAYSYSWVPTTGLNDPNIQSPVLTAPGTPGTTNYVCTITDQCGKTSTNNINITVVNGPNAGTDGTLTICETDAAVDLTNSLGGSPDAGGTWSPVLSAGGNSFDPSLDGSGTYTYTVPDPPGNPNCPDHSADVVVTVTPATVPNFAAVGPYCDGDAIPALPTTSTNGVTGTWSPAIDNTTTTLYTFTPTAGQCATTQTLTITVNPNVTPTFAPVGPYCDGDAIPALPTTSTNGITGTWSPAIDNTTTTLYTFTPDAGQCATTQTLTITITPNTTPTFAAVGPYCDGDAIPALPTTSTNGITGTWSPAIDNTTTTLYTFTPDAGQCATTQTLTITITPNTTPTFAAVGPYCDGDAIPALPTTSTNGITGTWSPAIDNTTTTLYTFTPDAGQCATTQTLTITIDPNITPTFAAVGPYCDGDAIPALPTTSTNGITGTWSPAIDNTTTTLYTFTPDAGQCANTQTLTITIDPNITPTFAAVGPYCTGAAIPALPTTSTNGITGTWSPAIDNTTTTLYTFTPDAGQCATTQTLTITISSSITPTFTAVGPYCDGDAVPALPTTSNNGITGTWSPAIDNTTTTLYTFTPDAGQCATTETLTITIDPNITPTFAAVGPYCDGDAIPALPTTSTNGITGTWSPAIDNTTTTLYTFTPDAGQCASTETLTITIDPNITPAFAAVGPYCDGDAIPALPTTSTNGITGTWSPAIDNTTTTLYTFTPDAGQCATTQTLTITIDPNITPTFAAVGPYCEGDAIPALPTTSTNGITGTWSPAIDNTTTTLYTFTPDAGQCATTETLTITITPSTTPTFAAVGPYCEGDAIPALPTTSTNGITGTWSPAIDNTTTTLYTFTPDAGQCATTQTLTITVNPLPQITNEASTDITDCLNPDGTITITANGTSYELFTSAGASVNSNATGSFTGINAGDYYVEITLNGCLSTSSTFTINNASAPAAPVAGTDATYCDGDVLADLTAAAGAGGTLNWYDDAGLSNNIGTGSPFTPNNTIGSTTYYVTETVLSCESAASTVTVTINAVPSAPVAGTDATYCSGDPLTDLTTAATNPNWYSDPGLTTNIGSGTSLTPNNTVGTTEYYVTETNSGCESAASLVTITINDIPTITSEIATDLSSCVSPNGTITITSNGTSYELFTSAGVSVSTNATGIFSNLQTGTYYVVVSNGNCTVTGNNLTINDVTSASNQTFNNSICTGSDFTYADGTVHTNITANETYVSTLVNSIGCDSIITENTTVLQDVTVIVDTTICEGSNYTSVGDAANFVNVIADFTHTSTLVGPNGCDSTIIENITVTPAASVDLGFDMTVCENATITIDASTSSGIPVWSTGDSTMSITVTITTDTFFVASLNSACGSGTDTIFISVFPPFTVDAGPDQTIPLGTSTTISASGAISYIWSPATFLDCHTCESTDVFPIQDVTYLVTGTDENGCTATDTISITIDGEIIVYIPNVFSPNGDNQNDRFGPYGPIFETFTMEIYNRWGQLVFKTETPGAKWDGYNLKSKPCPQAVFVYKIRGKLVTGHIVEKSGNVMLTR